MEENHGALDGAKRGCGSGAESVEHLPVIAHIMTSVDICLVKGIFVVFEESDERRPLKTHSLFDRANGFLLFARQSSLTGHVRDDSALVPSPIVIKLLPFSEDEESGVSSDV